MEDTNLKVVDLRSKSKAEKVANIKNESFWEPCVTITNNDGSKVIGSDKYDSDGLSVNVDLIDFD